MSNGSDEKTYFRDAQIGDFDYPSIRDKQIAWLYIFMYNSSRM